MALPLGIRRGDGRHLWNSPIATASDSDANQANANADDAARADGYAHSGSRSNRDAVAVSCTDGGSIQAGAHLAQLCHAPPQPTHLRRGGCSLGIGGDIGSREERFAHRQP